MSIKLSDNDICKRLKLVRKELNLTQGEFAKPLGINQSHISSIEKGDGKPSRTLLILISYHYSISQDWLFTGQGNIFQTDVIKHGYDSGLKSDDNLIPSDLLNDLKELGEIDPSEIKEVGTYVKYRLSKIKGVKIL